MNNKSLNNENNTNVEIEDFSSIDGEYIGEGSHIIDNNTTVNYGYNVMPPQPINNHIGKFVLLVCGKVVIHGSKDLVLAEAKSILYGQHAHFLNQKIELNDIVVLKKIPLKVGVFLDE